MGSKAQPGARRTQRSGRQPNTEVETTMSRRSAGFVLAHRNF